jgi:Flp pilus assembly protein TadG
MGIAGHSGGGRVVRRRTGTGTDDRGAAAVEFVLVLPLLIILVFGIIEFGLYFAQELSVSNAARQGARFAVVPNYGDSGSSSSTCRAILHQVQNAAGTIGMQGADVRVTVSTSSTGTACPTASDDAGLGGAADVVPCAGGQVGDVVTVTVEFTGHLIIPLVFSDPTLHVTSTGTYRCEFDS